MRNLLFYCILFILSLFNLASTHIINFMDGFLKWHKESDRGLRDCIIYNFGYEKELNIPMITLDLNSKNLDKLVLGTHGLQFPSSCSAIIIDKSFHENVDKILNVAR